MRYKDYFIIFINIKIINLRLQNSCRIITYYRKKPRPVHTVTMINRNHHYTDQNKKVKNLNHLNDIELCVLTQSTNFKIRNNHNLVVLSIR